MMHIRLFGLIIGFILLTLPTMAQDVALKIADVEIPITSPYTVTSKNDGEVTIQLADDPTTLTIRTTDTTETLPATLAEMMNASRAEPLDYTKMSLNGIPALVSDTSSGIAQMLVTWEGTAYEFTLMPVEDSNPLLVDTGSVWDTVLSNMIFSTADDAPLFIRFDTDITAINGLPLDINVNWELISRPDNSNLEFVQVLSTGEELNVELPRDNPFIASSGSGIIRVATLGGDDVVDLQVRLRDLTDDSILTLRQIILDSNVAPVAVAAPVQQNISGTGSDVITQFESVVAHDEQTTTITWNIAADSVEILRYQAVGAGGQAIIETLPNQISGTYTFAGEFQSVDETDEAIYGIATLSATISGTQNVSSTQINYVDQGTDPQLTIFALTDPDTVVNALPSQVSIRWELINRPPDSNLEFVQVLSEDVLINAELPRLDPFIASSGSGVVNVVASTEFDLSQPFDLRVRVRLVDGEGEIVTSRELLIPYVPSQ